MLSQLFVYFKKISWQKVLWLLLLVFLVVLHTKHNLDSDEGPVLNGAWNLFNNRHLYYDFFEYTPPGAYYLIYWSWLLLGVHYFVAKAMSILFIFGCLIGVYRIWLATRIDESILSTKIVYLSLFIFTFATTYWPTISYHVFNLFFVIWAAYFGIAALSAPTKNKIIISGLLSGLSCLFLQSTGFFTIFALATFLFGLFIKEKSERYLKMLLIFLISSLAPMLLLLFIWPAKLLLANLFIFPLANYTEVAKVSYSLLFFFIVLWVMIAVVFSKSKKKSIWLLLYLQLFLLISTFSLADNYHIGLIIFAFYVLLPDIIIKIKQSVYKKYWQLLIYLVIFIIIYPPLVSLINYPLFKNKSSNQLFPFLRANCNDSPYIYAGPFLPGLYFETEKLNPTPFSMLITRLNTPAQISLAAAQLAKNKPQCAVLYYQMVQKYKYNINNPVDSFILLNYHLIYEKEGVLVYKINKL